MINFEYFQNKKIAILWYGKEGKSTLNFLLDIGILVENITILDGAKKNDWLIQDLLYLDKYFVIKKPINITIGDSYLDELNMFDIIVKSPGISLYNEKIFSHRKKIISQAQIFFDMYKGKIIAISGTKWKSTTCTLIYEILKAAGKKVQLIGNIWNPMLDCLDIKNLFSQQDEYAVCEVSSYMLEWLTKKNYISILLNIYPDHLDWHQWFENYQKAKFSLMYGSEYNFIRYKILTKNQLESDDFKECAVQVFWKEGKYTYKDWVFFRDNKKLFDNKKILLQGEHNMINICSVIAVCDIMYIEMEIVKNILETFKWLPHRMENIGVHWWIVWVDDAISTTPESTIKAIETFWWEVDTIFLWGTDRWYKFKELAKKIIEYKIRNVVIFPDSGERIYKEIKKYTWGEIKFFHTSDMYEAVKFAYEYTKDYKICLLSTASPSYSVWKNFEEKWDIFQKYIKKLAQ